MNPLVREELANILAEHAAQARHATAGNATLAGFEWYDFNAGGGPLLVQTARDRSEREVLRIVAWYAWGPLELTRLLDRFEAENLGALSRPALAQVLARMRALEDATQTGCGPPDAPPA